MLSLVNNFIDKPKLTIPDSYWKPTAEKLMVQDFGKGIPVEDLDKSTEAFYMVEVAFPGQWKCGFCTFWIFVEKNRDIHGFQMKIESEIGKGTCVFIEW